LTRLPDLPDLKLGSGSSSRLLGIVVMGVDIVCSSRFVFVEGVYRGGFSGFLRGKEGIQRIEEKKGVL
jgi:hypothetical protein